MLNRTPFLPAKQDKRLDRSYLLAIFTGAARASIY